MEIIIILIVLGCIIFGQLIKSKIAQQSVEERRKEKALTKGVQGELAVAHEISRWANGNGYLINDVVLRDPQGDTYQIDHIFINWNGIWVIETKNWAGSIYGTDEDKQWTQVLGYGETKNSMYNPVKQNLTHVKKLREIVGKKPIVLPLVVFVGGDISNVKSVYTCSMERLTNLLGRNFGEVITPQEMKEYYKTLLFYQDKCGVTSAEHAQIQEERKELIRQGVCPRCGGNLVRREGMYGAFYGCSNYPECKVKIKIDE